MINKRHPVSKSLHGEDMPKNHICFYTLKKVCKVADEIFASDQ